MRPIRSIIAISVLFTGLVLAADNVEKQAREAVNKAIKEKTLDAADMPKYIERINSGKAAEVLKELAGKKTDESASGGWPGWTGPNYNCTSDEKGLLKEWPKEGPKVLWRVPIEKGWNHPSVLGDDIVFAETKRGTPYGEDQTESVVCLSASTGKQKWKYSYKCPFYMSFQGGGAGWQDGGVYTTPAITDKYVISVGLVGETHCFDRKTGKVLWNINLRDFNPRFAAKKYVEWKGFDISPVVVGGVIPYFIHHYQENLPAEKRKATTLFFGLSADTGKVVWQFETPTPGMRGGGNGTTYPIPVKYGKEDCVLLAIDTEWRVIRVSDGKQVFAWKNSKEPGYWKAPIPAGKNLFYDPLEGQCPGQLVECDFSKGSPSPRIVWQKEGTPTQNYTPETVQNGCLFGFMYDKREDFWNIADKLDTHTVSLRCHDLKNGELLWKENKFKHGLSISAADGMLYVRDFQRLTLVEANPKKYIEKGSIEKLHNLGNGRFSPGLGDWVMPVIAYGRLYIRTPLEMICYEIKIK